MDPQVGEKVVAEFDSPPGLFMRKTPYHIGIGPLVRAAVNRARKPINLGDLSERLSRSMGRHVSRQAVERHVSAMIRQGKAKRGEWGTVVRSGKR